MRSNNVPITSPCHESWDAMDGGEASRFCGVCQKDVHNLSALAEAEARALLAARAGERLCVRYSSESDGTMRFRDLVPMVSLTRRIVRTAFAAVMLAACTPYGGPSDIGHEVIEVIREGTVPTADGGCDYTTGPFTTFHLPPGHLLCRQAGAQERNGVALADPQGWPPPTPMGEPRMIEPPPTELVPSPVEPPVMGAMVAEPDPVEPFVPCDPAPVVKPSEPAKTVRGETGPALQPRGTLGEADGLDLGAIHGGSALPADKRASVWTGEFVE